jgi:hypothetical protein
VSHDCVLLAPSGDSWDWDTFTIGVFEWVPSKQVIGGKQRGPVIVRVVSRFNQTGIEKAKVKVEEIIRALDYGVYSGPTRINLVRGV